MKTVIKGIFYGFMLFLGVLLALPGVGHNSFDAYVPDECSLPEQDSSQHIDQVSYGLSDLLRDVTLESVFSVSSASSSTAVPRRQWHSSSNIGFGFSCPDQLSKTPDTRYSEAEATTFIPYHKLDHTRYYIYSLHRIRV